MKSVNNLANDLINNYCSSSYVKSNILYTNLSKINALKSLKTIHFKYGIGICIKTQFYKNVLTNLVRSKSHIFKYILFNDLFNTFKQL